MESFLKFYIGHLDPIVQWLFVAILAVSVFYLFRLITRKGENETTSNPVPAQDLEETLKKILTSLDGVRVEGQGPASANPGASVPGQFAAASDPAVELRSAKLASDLKAKEAEIEKLKESLKGRVGDSREEAEKYRLQIKDLEARLMEYEIIEDDIADLSRYREENDRLKEELAAIRRMDQPSPVPLAVEEYLTSDPEAAHQPMPEEGPQPSPQELADQLLAEAERKRKQGKAIEQEVSEPVEEEVPQQPEIQVAPEKPVKVEAPVKAQAKVKGKPAPAPVPAEPRAADDIFAEYSGSEGSEAAVDTDKMLAEMAGLEDVESGDGGLEAETDFEKMADEASKLGSQE